MTGSNSTLYSNTKKGDNETKQNQHMLLKAIQALLVIKF